MINVINTLNELCDLYLKEERGSLRWTFWKDIIRLLPKSYKQIRTVDLNYEVLSHIVKDRKGHRLNEWDIFIRVIHDELPYASELIFCEE
ncbi:MAG: hypothetical protein IJI41_10745 [Anaerolineaceae bacterium]|nr:hypothetical protein [Anaerolineaceae bacterium]